MPILPAPHDRHEQMGERNGHRQRAVDRSTAFVAGRGARSDLRRRTIRPPRAAGAARVEGRDAGQALFIRECSGQRAARVLFRDGARRPAVAATRGARARRPPLAPAQRQWLLFDRRSARRRRAVVPRDRHRARSVSVDPAHARRMGEIRPGRARARRPARERACLPRGDRRRSPRPIRAPSCTSPW